jgi:hypothetical protein
MALSRPPFIDTGYGSRAKNARIRAWYSGAATSTRRNCPISNGIGSSPGRHARGR